MDRIDRFRRLARSSPWRWTSVRFTFDDGDFEPVRAWLRRPDSLRIEGLDGRLLEARPGDRTPPGFGVFLVGTGPLSDEDEYPDEDQVQEVEDDQVRDLDQARAWNEGQDQRQVRDPGEAPARGPDRAHARDPLRTLPQPIWWTDRLASRPSCDADGLVVDPVELPAEVAIDDPMWQNYRWVAMLNPRELADGEGGAVPVEVDSISAAIRHGRPTLFATVRPVDGYAPRCTCCPLLPSRQAVIAEGYGDPDAPFAEAHRVALDLATSICVSARELGGPRDGHGFDVVIEAVDVPLGDDLFRMTDELRLRRQR